MKISCQSCQAKYTIADEKVLGKVVKIRCKKCSSTIVVNGNEAGGEDQSTAVYDYAQQGGNDQWTVNIADGDQRTLSPHEIAALYREGVVTDETYCWQDGMADWLPLRDVPPLSAAVHMDGAPAMTFDESGSSAVVSQSDRPAPAPSQRPAMGYGDPTATVAEAAASSTALFGDTGAAARRTGGRAQGADLFGAAAAAGSEEEVMTSAPSASNGFSGGGGGGGLEEQKLTGQRNENSVLFSLSALTESGPKSGPATSNATTATADASGLIDIRALSATMAKPSGESSARVDDIMNLSGGGAFAAALAAPVLAPPPLDVVDPGLAGGGGAKSNMPLILAVLGGALILAIGIVVAVVLTRSPDAATAEKGSEGESRAAATTATSTTPEPVAAPAPAPEPTTAAVAPGEAPAAAGGGGTKVAAAHKPAGGGGGGGGTKVASAPASDPAPAPAAPSKPTSLADAMRQSSGASGGASAPSGGGASTKPFDRGAAAGALGGVNVQACKKPGGPTGGGHVTVTFAPDGSVSSAVVDQPPYAGTPVGGCVAGKYRGAHIPAFSGAPVKVGKSFQIN